jgi:hypothetical protein
MSSDGIDSLLGMAAVCAFMPAALLAVTMAYWDVGAFAMATAATLVALSNHEA